MTPAHQRSNPPAQPFSQPPHPGSSGGADLRKSVDREGGWLSEILGQSKCIQVVKDLIRRVGPTQASVLVTGESGTGKELVARAVHQCSSRAAMEFIVVDCASLPEQLLESELFGHEKGAFTGAERERQGLAELADGGTLFLDEIGEMPFLMQSKLLRFLQFGEFRRVGGNRTLHANVRVIAATNHNLAASVSTHQFRDDLFYRLNVITILLAPLRDRPQDIPVLATAFLAKFSAEQGTEKCFDESALRRIQHFPWPGNIRELQNFVQRVSILTSGIRIDEQDVSRHLPDSDHERPGNVIEGQFPSLAELERQHILQALEQTGGNKGEACELLGISLRTLYNRIKEYGLAP